MNNHLNILAIEGVQGAGKTTLINNICYEGGVWDFPLISNINRPRTFNHLDNGAGLSLITDLLWYTSAVQDWFLVPDFIPRIIDRFIVSQWIYGKLRKETNSIEVSLDEVVQLTQSMDEFLYAFIPRINQEFRRRIGRNTLPCLAHTNLLYIFLLPPIKEIFKHRNSTGEQYTFHVRAEYALYLKAYEVLSSRQDIKCILLTENLSQSDLLEKINEAFLSFSS